MKTFKVDCTVEVVVEEEEAREALRDWNQDRDRSDRVSWTDLIAALQDEQQFLDFVCDGNDGVNSASWIYACLDRLS